MNVDIIEKKFRDHDFIYRDLGQAFGKAKIEIVFPISLEILKDFSNRISSIFEAIIDCAKKDNLYSAFILYRALLEHFFKALFITDKMLKMDSDETAEKYKKHLMISEVLAQNAGVLEMEDLIDENKNKTGFIEFLIKKFPELKGFDKSNQQEISSAIKQFSLKDIVKYLYSTYKEIDSLKGTNPIIAETIPEYSMISTFTHGGSYASVLMEKFGSEKTIEEQLNKILLIGLTSTCTIKENSFLPYRLDKSFLEIS